MILSKSFFKKPNISLEGSGGIFKHGAAAEEKALCPKCKKQLTLSELKEAMYICPGCGHYIRIPARERAEMMADEGTFTELFKDMSSQNLIGFPDYDKKLEDAETVSGENEAVITGMCTIGGIETALFVMDARFMMGSMGTVVGEKLTLLFEKACEQRLPVVGYTVSGGARMQEGILSLMQMAKVSGAVKRHSDAGLLYIVVLTDPTTGGVTASFAMEGDIILSEPRALIGFAGPRVIEQTIRQKLPKGFQCAERLMEKGFIDNIAKREDQRKILSDLLAMHCGRAQK